MLGGGGGDHRAAEKKKINWYISLWAEREKHPGPLGRNNKEIYLTMCWERKTPDGWEEKIQKINISHCELRDRSIVAGFKSTHGNHLCNDDHESDEVRHGHHIISLWLSMNSVVGLGIRNDCQYSLFAVGHLLCIGYSPDLFHIGYINARCAPNDPFLVLGILHYKSTPSS